MNERLKFSWGHILAFLTLIAVSYISFMGFTYLTNGDFNFALFGMGITDIVFILFFIGAQQMKASGVKMRRKIIWERIFIFGSPIVFIAGMISMSHFWTVRSQNDEIVSTFTTSINDARQLFTDYEEYSNQRIETYQNNLNRIINNKATDPLTYRKAGFEDSKATIQRDNMVETLRLQLLSQNYDSLRNVASAWIDNADQGASTWNVFLLGNTREIKEALNNWENQLKNFSFKEMSNETLGGEVIHFQSNGANNAIAGIDSLIASFTTQKFPTLAAIIFGIVIYIMLLFPYCLQERHTKSSYTNIISKKRGGKTIKIDESNQQLSNTPHRGTFRIE
ncbi:MAG: hypothetical protein HDR88_03525 [Bacteroides sp.]|nr:hypothetical protein [Bacteroides sp.]